MLANLGEDAILVGPSDGEPLSLSLSLSLWCFQSFGIVEIEHLFQQT